MSDRYDPEDEFIVQELRILNPDSAFTYQRIDLQSSNVIKTIRGTEYYFSPGFVQSLEQDTIMVKVSEFFTNEEILASGLTSTTRRNLLVSSGMFNIELLTIDSIMLDLELANPVLVRIPVDRVDNANMLYKGIFDNGMLFWDTPTLQNTNFLIPLPDSLLQLNPTGTECIAPKEWISELKGDIYQNTYLHTMEFERRWALLGLLGCHSSNPGVELDRKLLDVYINNVGQDLYKSDSLALEAIEEKYGSQIDTTVDLSTWEWSEKYVLSYGYVKLKELYQLKHKQPFDISRDDMELYRLLRKNIIAQRERAKEMMTTIGYLFNVDLGWSNIDKLYKSTENTEGYDINIILNDVSSIEDLFATLTFPDQNVYIPLTIQTSNDKSKVIVGNGIYNIPTDLQADLFISGVQNGSIRYFYEHIHVESDTAINIALNKTFKDRYLKN